MVYPLLRGIVVIQRRIKHVPWASFWIMRRRAHYRGINILPVLLKEARDRTSNTGNYAHRRRHLDFRHVFRSIPTLADVRCYLRPSSGFISVGGSFF